MCPRSQFLRLVCPKAHDFLCYPEHQDVLGRGYDGFRSNLAESLLRLYKAVGQAGMETYGLHTVC